MQENDVQLLAEQASVHKDTTLRRFVSGLKSERLGLSIVLLNLMFLFGRPQVVFPFLSSSGLTIVLFLLAFALWLPKAGKAWHYYQVLLVGFLAFHAVFIFIGRFVFEELIANDGRALGTWRNLAQQIFCFYFPIIVYCSSIYSLRRLVTTLVVLSVWLSVYALTHSGTGPGGFLGDENDLCQTLLMLMPFPIILALSRKGFTQLFFVFVSVLSLGGIVATSSRGGFVGLVGSLAFVYWFAPRKGPLIVLSVLIGLIGLALVPQEYWGDMGTIYGGASEGTGLERMDTWSYVVNMFLDPKNTIQGVGLENTPYRLAPYEAIERGITQKSLHGRSVHSTYFQLLGDQGLIGVVFFALVFLGSAWRVMKAIPRLEKLKKHLALQNSSQSRQDAGSHSLYSIANDLYLFALALTCSWVGVLGAGAFISTFYYPPMWFLTTLGILHINLTNNAFNLARPDGRANNNICRSHTIPIANENSRWV